MILRLVQMQFELSRTSEFLEVFAIHRKALSEFPGCLKIELLRDINDPGRFSTLSHWDSAQHLEDYRQSDLFKLVWQKVKPMFRDKAQAFSMETISFD